MKTTLLKTLCLTTLIMGSAFAQNKNVASTDPVKDQIDLIRGSVQVVLDSLRNVDYNQSESVDEDYEEAVAKLNAKLEPAIKQFGKDIEDTINTQIKGYVKQYYTYLNQDRPKEEKDVLLNSVKGPLETSANKLTDIYYSKLQEIYDLIPGQPDYETCYTNSCLSLISFYYGKVAKVIQSTLDIELVYKIGPSYTVLIWRKDQNIARYNGIKKYLDEHPWLVDVYYPLTASSTEFDILNDIIKEANGDTFDFNECKDNVKAFYEQLYSLKNISDFHHTVNLHLASLASDKLGQHELAAIQDLDSQIQAQENEIKEIEAQISEVRNRPVPTSRRERRRQAQANQTELSRLNQKHDAVIKSRNALLEKKKGYPERLAVTLKAQRTACLYNSKSNNVTRILAGESSNCSIDLNGWEAFRVNGKREFYDLRWDFLKLNKDVDAAVQNGTCKF